jgi:hypothetical protein
MNVRPFRAEDAAAVAALWRYWFHDKVRGPAPRLEAWARSVYAERPATDPDIPSLIAEDDEGRLAAFLGATVTPLSLDGDRVGRLAGLFPPLVDPERAPPMVATLLLRRFLAGPQDLTISDGGHPKYERIWEGLGGRVDPLASLRWIQPLRPAALGLRRFRRGRRVLAPLAAGADALARRVAPGRLTAGFVPLSGGRSERPAAPVTVRAATPRAWRDAADALRSRARARPVRSDADVDWQFARLTEIGSLQPLRIATAHDPRDAIVGAWVAGGPPGGVVRVFALDATDKHAPAVFAALLADADAAGAGALLGRMAPRWRRPVADARCLLHAGGSLRLVHARDPALMDDALLGRVAIDRLDGEAWYWWAVDDG